MFWGNGEFSAAAEEEEGCARTGGSEKGEFTAQSFYLDVCPDLVTCSLSCRWGVLCARDLHVFRHLWKFEWVWRTLKETVRLWLLSVVSEAAAEDIL